MMAFTCTRTIDQQLASASQPELIAIVKFADDTTVVGLVSGRDESTCRDEVEQI